MASPKSDFAPWKNLSQTLESDDKGTEPESKELEQRHLTEAQFQGLTAVPPKVKWFATIRNVNTKKVYKRDVQEFICGGAEAGELSGGDAGAFDRVAGCSIRRCISIVNKSG